MTEEHWQIQIFKRSIKKKDKLKLLEKGLKINTKDTILDLGCAQGILSHFLRQKGGFWVSVDQDFANMQTAKSLLEKNLLQIGPGILPFKGESFNKVVSLDYLEHIEDDELCLQEIHRVLKKGGQLILSTPHIGKFLMLHRLRSLLGMKLEFFGHKREGYNLKELKPKLENAQLQLENHRTFSRFFSEFIELIINFLYIKFYSKKGPGKLRDGHIKPASSEEFQSKNKTFKFYSLVYPVVWFFSRLDKLLFFHKGYSLLVWAKKSD